MAMDITPTRSLEDVGVPFLDLASLHEAAGPGLADAFASVLASGRFVGGEVVERFEADFADYCGAHHATGVANGTDALELTLRALGIGPGDEVILPTNTFVATATAVVAAGAIPRMVDVDPGTLLLNPEAVTFSTGPRTAAVIVVQLFGEMPNMPELAAAAERAGIALIEDSAQAHGATWDSQRAGTFGVAGCFSFYPGKNLGALGDGGAVVTDDLRLAERIRALGNHGREANDHHRHSSIGRNSRLDALQAAFLEVKLRHLDEWNAGRRRAAQRYDEQLAHVGPVRVIERERGSVGSHHLHPIEVPDREQVRVDLARRGVSTGIHYPVPCHRQPVLAQYSTGVLPVAERAASRLLSLPLSPTITDAEVDYVCEALADVTAGVPS